MAPVRAAAAGKNRIVVRTRTGLGLPLAGGPTASRGAACAVMRRSAVPAARRARAVLPRAVTAVDPRAPMAVDPSAGAGRNRGHRLAGRTRDARTAWGCARMALPAITPPAALPSKRS